VHQASLKGVGCDCLGLLRGVWRELYGEEPEEILPYSLDWAEATGAETLYIALERHCREVTPEQIAPGDIALFRMLPRGPAKHCGIVASKDLTSPNAGRSEREALRVGGALTLIHSRQNKRVSEEPFSAFWRDRLAFAFRLRG
jgi:NlpC/P60 family putative phage cell wall peptidase